MLQQFREVEKNAQKTQCCKSDPLKPPVKKLPFPFITFAPALATVFCDIRKISRQKLTVMDSVLNQSRPLVNTSDSSAAPAAQFNKPDAAQPGLAPAVSDWVDFRMFILLPLVLGFRRPVADPRR